MLTDRMVGRELVWAGLHATLGLFVGSGRGDPPALDIVRDGTFPVWWRAGLENESSWPDSAGR